MLMLMLMLMMLTMTRQQQQQQQQQMRNMTTIKVAEENKRLSWSRSKRWKESMKGRYR